MKKIVVLLLLTLLTAVACNDPLVADYDAQIDHRVNALQNKMNRFLGDLQRNAGTPLATYDNNKRFYVEVRSDLVTLRQIVAQAKRNETTLNALAPFEQNVNQLETMHRNGISAAEVPILRSIFDSQFGVLLQLEDAKLRGKRKKDVGR